MPPETYAAVFHPDDAEKVRAMATMQSDWRNVLLLEYKRHSDELANSLWESCKVQVCFVVRLIWCLFERDRWDYRSDSGRHLLRGCLECLNDNKATEELHHHVRMDKRGNANQKQTMPHIHDVVINSGVVESREIPHRAVINKDAFVRNSHDKKRPKPPKHRFASCRHKLFKIWSK